MRQFLDTQYGMRKDSEIFKIDDSVVLVDQDGDIPLRRRNFGGQKGCGNYRHVREWIRSTWPKTIWGHKKILLMTNAHLEGYQPAGVINVSGGKTFRDIIAPLSRGPKAKVSNRGNAVHGKNTKISDRALYNNPAKPSAFSTVDKLTGALSKKNKSEVRAWLEQQESYTTHRPVRKRFLRNPYTGSNIMDVWECQLLDYRPSQSTMICTDTFNP